MKTGLVVLAGALLWPAGQASAQAPDWSGATTGSTTQAAGASTTRAVATDTSGNVLVTGYFTGQVYFGSTLLSSQGSSDMFVAKYVPSTGTWAWAASGGGTSADLCYGIAVSGSEVYVTGAITNSAANANGVVFGDSGPAAGTVPVNGASRASSYDVLVAKYTDHGSSATLDWTQVGGGTDADYGYGLAVSSGNVYVTGSISNNTTNDNGVVFGGGGTTAGTAPVSGATSTASADLVVAKYTDNGASATLAWTQVGGGIAPDYGQGIAVSGSSVYVTGALANTLANSYGVLFGGSGTTAGTEQVNGAGSAGSYDIVLAKYTDNGSSATLGWTQVGGGTSADIGYGVAVRGNSVYLAGYLTNNTANASSVVFGGGGTTAGTVPVNGASSATSSDLVLAKYLDNGPSATLVWTQVGGGTSTDYGYGLALSGSNIYVTGSINNTTANDKGVVFGGSGTTAGTEQVNGASSTASSDLVVAKYTDNGPSATLAWTQVGGGTASDQGQGIAVSGQKIYAVGYVAPTATFGSYRISSPSGSQTTALAQLADKSPAPLPVQLVAFTATAQGNAAVRLAWTTASEQNSARFEVERSQDGVAFSAIGKVTAAGSTTAAHTYGLTDAALPAGARVLYYRLRQVDLDGTFRYSPVRVVALGGGLALFPNPALHQSTLSGVAPGQAVQVFDAVGRLVLAATADANGAAGLALPAGLPGGVYVVRAGQQALRLAVE